MLAGTEGTLADGCASRTWPVSKYGFLCRHLLSGPGLLPKLFSALVGKPVPTKSLSLKNNPFKIIFRRDFLGVQTLLPFWRQQTAGQEDLGFSRLLAGGHTFSPRGPGLRLFVPGTAADSPAGRCPREEREATVPCTAPSQKPLTAPPASPRQSQVPGPAHCQGDGDEGPS